MKIFKSLTTGKIGGDQGRPGTIGNDRGATDQDPGLEIGLVVDEGPGLESARTGKNDENVKRRDYHKSKKDICQVRIFKKSLNFDKKV